jgi:hypothetical protein
MADPGVVQFTPALMADFERRVKEIVAEAVGELADENKRLRAALQFAYDRAGDVAAQGNKESAMDVLLEVGRCAREALDADA